MGTSKRFKSENTCIKCGESVVNWSAERQALHEIECKKQKKLFD